MKKQFLEIIKQISEYKIPAIIVVSGIAVLALSMGLYFIPEKDSEETIQTDWASETQKEESVIPESGSEFSKQDPSEESSDYSSKPVPTTATPSVTVPATPDESSKEDESVEESNLKVWNPASGTKSNDTYDVYVRESGTESWQELFVYNIKIGHQEGNDPLRALVGMTYSGPEDASMVTFDFNGKVDFKIIYNNALLNEMSISPTSYNIEHEKEGNTVFFSVYQDEKAPRKIVLRPNNDWRTEVLHIMTNPMQEDIPDKTSPEVYVIRQGDKIPRVLPEGKSVYYFEKGKHVLPRGAWVEFDLGSEKKVNSFDLISGEDRPFLVPGGQKFRIEYKLDINDDYKTCYETLTNNNTDVIGREFPAVKARYIRLVLLGNNAVKTQGGYNYLHSSHIKEFRLFEEGTKENVVLNKAVDGSFADYPNASNGNDVSLAFYGHIYAGESFFIPKSNYTIYLDYGAVVKGAVNSDWQQNIEIRGRGIMDGSDLVHNPANEYAEGRTSAIRAHYAEGILVEGITFLDYPMWGIVTINSMDVEVRNIHYFGSIVNSDGVNMSGVTNGLLEGSFFRTCDDAFVMYHYGPADNVTARNSVFFSDGGRIVLIGMANDRGDIRNVTFKNNDILNTQNVWNMYVHGGAFSVWASGGNLIENILFKDIRVERAREPDIASFFQFKTINDHHGWGPGNIDKIVMENIDYKGGGKGLSYALGENENYSVKNLVFRNVRIDGKKMSENHKPNIEFKDHVYNITYE